jgi:CheY-like chemotaxis protein
VLWCGLRRAPPAHERSLIARVLTHMYWDNGPPAARVTGCVDCAPVVAGGGKGIVLVVDDEPAIRLLCKVNLELAGYEVIEAATLAEARSLLDERIAVVLLDMHVGRERSESFLDEVKSAEIPVVVVSGSTDLERLKGRADGVLGKPFAIDDLEAVVERLTAR